MYSLGPPRCVVADTAACVFHTTLNRVASRALFDSRKEWAARLVFGPFANWGNVTVTAVPSDCRWSVASDAAWLQFRYDPGRSGNGGFGYSVPGNSTPHPRSANLVVLGTGGTSAVRVVDQERPRSCSYVVIPALTRLTLAGGTASFRVDATPESCRWTTFMYSQRHRRRFGDVLRAWFQLQQLDYDRSAGPER